MMFLLPRLMTLPQRPDQGGVLGQTITDTHLVDSWVIAAFLLFEVTVFLFDEFDEFDERRSKTILNDSVPH